MFKESKKECRSKTLKTRLPFVFASSEIGLSDLGNVKALGENLFNLKYSHRLNDSKD